jgi:small subunit ribosomal protein S17
MTDDTNTEETPEETPVEETPAAEVEETPAAEEAPAEQAAAEEAPVEDAPAEEPVAEVEETPAAEEAPAEEAVPDIDPSLPRKERLRLLKSRESGEAKPTRTPEERQAERVALRKQKAAARSRRRKQEREKARAARTDAPAQVTPPKEHGRAGTGSPKVRTGIVVSDKADKTITVRIEDARRHRRYEKIVRSSSTLHAHDEANDANEGDRVTVVESRPLSRTKRWRLVEVLERAK